MMPTPGKKANEYERLLSADGQTGLYALRLYVAGTTPRSMLAIRNIQHICEKHLGGKYDLEVIDIYQYPEAATQAQIIAAPTLIKLSPEPVRRAIGDLSNEVKVLYALGIPDNGIYGT
jgi:circadian clock protein KaiB